MASIRGCTFLGCSCLREARSTLLFPEEELKHDFEAQRYAYILDVYPRQLVTQHRYPRKLLRIVVQDITALGVIHNDLTAFNLLLGRNPHVKRCPRHNTVHKWRIVDFDTACMIDPLHCTETDLSNVKYQAKFIGRRGFWGECE